MTDQPMIAFGEERYKPALMEMWRLCFPADGEDFVRFYFSGVYTDEGTLLCLEEGVPVAALQVIPYPFKIGSTIGMAGYISGAMTHPDHRRRGHMEQLLQSAFRVMEERGYSYSFLIPQEDWLFRFYEKYGYEKAFPVSRPERIVNFDPQCKTADSLILRDKEVRIHTSFDTLDFDDFYSVYYRFLTGMRSAVLKTKPQTKLILEDLFLSRGTLFFNDWGLALVFPEGREIVVREFFYFDEEIRNEFLKTFVLTFPDKEILLQNDSNEFLTHKGMIKPLGAGDVPTAAYLGMMLD